MNNQWSIVLQNGDNNCILTQGYVELRFYTKFSAVEYFWDCHTKFGSFLLQELLTYFRDYSINQTRAKGYYRGEITKFNKTITIYFNNEYP